MRLWSLHPRYLDPQGLVALWREALLARAVLRGETRGYLHHPQLERFRAHPHPRLAINAYLAAVHAEAMRRGYRFDRGKLGLVRAVEGIAVATGQLEFEREHLRQKLERRNPALLAALDTGDRLETHPLFRRCPGNLPEAWERPAAGRL